MKAIKFVITDDAIFMRTLLRNIIEQYEYEVVVKHPMAISYCCCEKVSTRYFDFRYYYA